MDYFAFETLMVFYDGLLRRAKSRRVIVLRSLAVACVVGGPACFGLAFLVTDEVQSYLVVAGTVCLLAFFVLTLWCAALVTREQKRE